MKKSINFLLIAAISFMISGCSLFNNTSTLNTKDDNVITTGNLDSRAEEEQEPTNTVDNTQTITLYFGNSNANKVVAEKREVEVSKGQLIEEVIFLELMKGPTTTGLHPVIPKGTRILSVTTKDGICTLDLSSEFVDNHPGGTAGESMTLNSIICSLTELSNVKKVQFLIDGQKRDYYTHSVFDQPFERTADMIGKQ